MKKLKWGVIGAGGIADRRTIPGMMLAENAELTAVMDVNPSLAEKIREKYGARRAYADEGELLADPEVEAVYIASPVFCHYDQAMAAARARKHILVEKPAALTVEKGEEILAACEKEGVLCAGGLMMRYHAAHREMKRIVSSGKLGQLVSCRAQLTCWYPPIPGAWRQQSALSGGGALMDMGIHCIDLITYVAGSPARKVFSFCDSLTQGYEVEDSALAVFQLDNGALCHVDAHFNIPDDAARCRFEVYGTAGSMFAEGTISQVEGGELSVLCVPDGLSYDAGQQRPPAARLPVGLTFGNMYQKEIFSFGQSVLFGAPLEVPIEDTLRAQRAVELAYLAGRTGRMQAIE